MDADCGGQETWLTPAQAAALFPMSPRALRACARRGLISTHRTPGGHRRYREAEVLALIDALAETAA